MNAPEPNPGVPWPATDGLGRTLPTHEDVGPPKENKHVGIFYFLWMGQHNHGPNAPYDLSKMLAEDPDLLQKPDSPLWGPNGAMHFWGESIHGYYQSDDPWVIRRHAHLLADAGIDTLIFDTTNRVTYKNVYMKLLEVFDQVRKEGGRTPHVTFMCNTRAGETAQELYNDLYKPGLYEELWFRWEGKPFLICDPADASEEVTEFFTLRKAHWPFEMVNTQNAWHWEAAYPQPYGYTNDPDVPEQVNVSVAQNLRIEDGKVTNMSSGNARGRSFHEGAVDQRPDAINWGYNAQEQWERALKLDPPFIMVTGWNEWIAGKWARSGEPIVFVDQYDAEHSRDIEMVKGGHQDHYYYQLVANVRRYKGAPALPEASGQKSIDIAGPFSQWEEVKPEFVDHRGEDVPRDHPGIGELHYTNRTGRNELEVMKVARDDTHVYFYARTAKPLSERQDPNWMLLLIDSDHDPQTGWEGYNFIVNRNVGEETTSLERHQRGWNWAPVEEVQYRAEGNELHIAIPRKALGLEEGSASLVLDFKWVDNWQEPGKIMDLYSSGDVAPEGRFKFRYEA